MANNKFIGVVMTGGKSRRMGTNKALLKRDGQTMAEFTQQTLTQAGASKVYFSVPFQSTAPEYTKDSATTAIADLSPDLGPLGAIQAILTHVVSQQIQSPILFVPVDLPLLTQNALSQLAAYELSEEPAVTFHRQPLPLLLQPSQDILHKLNAVIKQGDNLSIFHFLDEIGAGAIKIDDPDVLFNSNRPEEWQSALAKIKH